jgi:hypothetical protein
MARKSNPTVIPLYRLATPAEPPADLGPAGRQLWTAILADWVIDDAASLAVLAQAAHAADRAEGLRRQLEQLEAAGALARSTTLVTAELGARSLVARLLGRLGVLDTDEKRRGPGRPPRVGGW